jgi:hypothetical protein
MFAPLILEEARYGGNRLKKQAFRHSSQLYRRERRFFPQFQAFFGFDVLKSLHLSRLRTAIRVHFSFQK